MSNYISFNDPAELENDLKESPAALVFFTTLSCSVAESLEDKVHKSTLKIFPDMLMYIVDIHNNPEIAARFQVFVEPTVLVFFQGKETIRKSRNFSLLELEKELKRYHSLIFD